MPPVTSQIPGEGTSSLLYTVPGDGLDIETVYAEIDTSAAAGAVTAELTIQDQSGVVIARKTQGVTIPAGTTGSATWALRGDDESAASGGAGTLTVTTGVYTVTPTTVVKNTSAKMPLAFSSGTALLDLTTPTSPTVLAAGVYVFLYWARIVIALGGAPTGGSAHVAIINTGTTGAPHGFLTYPTAAGTYVPQWSTDSEPAQLAAGTVVEFLIANGDNAANRVYDSPGIRVALLSITP